MYLITCQWPNSSVYLAVPSHRERNANWKEGSLRLYASRQKRLRLKSRLFGRRLPPFTCLGHDWSIINLQCLEMLHRTDDLSPLVRKLQGLEVGRSLSFSNQLEGALPIVVIADDAPVRVIIADYPGKRNLKAGREFEITENVAV